MELTDIKPIIEALIFASDHPITFDRIVNILEAEDRGVVREALNELISEHEARDGGIVIDRVAGGYRLSTRTTYAPWIKKLFKTAVPKISRAAMEALSIIAYKQPVTRGELEGIRGVDSGGVIKKLMDRRLIKITGRKETPGRPVVYGTTREFLESFDLKDLSHLPTLKDIQLPDTDEDLLDDENAPIVNINDETESAQLELSAGPNEETADTETDGDLPPQSLLEAEPDGEDETDTEDDLETGAEPEENPQTEPEDETGTGDQDIDPEDDGGDGDDEAHETPTQTGEIEETDNDTITNGVAGDSPESETQPEDTGNGPNGEPGEEPESNS